MERSRPHAVVLRFDDPMRGDAPHVVYLHGRGSSEQEAAPIARMLPRASLRAYRGPLPAGGGHAWFENEGIGVARPDSLARECSTVADWIKADNGASPPWLCGFSNGAAMAASLALIEPDAYAGLIMIGGCFALEDLPAGRLRAMPVLFCRGEADMVIPKAKFAQARSYLFEHSGARVEMHSYSGGHEITGSVLQAVAEWFGAQTS